MKKFCVVLGLVLAVIASAVIFSACDVNLNNSVYSYPTTVAVTLYSGDEDATFNIDEVNVSSVTYDSENGASFYLGGLYMNDGTFRYAMPTKDECIVIGWKYKVNADAEWSNTYINVHNSSLTVMPFSDHIYLMAVWSDAYSVTLDRQSGTTGDTSITTAEGEPMPIATMPTRTGYIFGGYYTGESGTGTKYYNADGTSAHAFDDTSLTTLYAKWTLQTFTVTLNSNDNTFGTLSSSSVTMGYGATITTSSNTITFGATEQNDPITITATPTTATAQYTYAFSSWSNGTATVEGALTVTANFTRTGRSYNISYTMNSGSHSGSYDTSYTFSTSSQTKSIGTASRTGYDGSVSTSVGSISSSTLTIPANTTGNITVTWSWETQSDYFIWTGTNNTELVGFSSTGYANANKNIIIPAKTTKICEGAFRAAYWTNASTGNYSSDSGVISVTFAGNSVTSIGESAFAECSSLTSITIPNSVTSIKGNTFGGCSGLTSITIPDSVTSIGDVAFNGCTGLTSVTIPNSVTSIGMAAFMRCTGLTSITVPSSVTSLGSDAFSMCSGLTSITIGSGVTSIKGWTFIGCSSLTSITILATNPPTLSNTNAFDSTNNCPIYVPSASVNAYKTASVWSNFADRIQAKP